MQPDAKRILENLRAHAVTSRDDARLVVFGKLHDAELRACNFKGAGTAGVRAAAPCGLFVAESPRAIECAMRAGARPFAVLVDETFLDIGASEPCAGAELRTEAEPAATPLAWLVSELADAWPQTPVFLADSEEFCRITEYPLSRGIMAVFARPEPLDAAALLRSLDADGARKRRVCIVENVTNYANMASIFKSAAAFGIDAVLITPSCHDPWYRRCVRVSDGAVFDVPWAYTNSPDATESAELWSTRGIQLLHEAGYTVVALALKDDALSLDDPRFKACEKLAFVLGTEGEGLDPRTIAACDFTAIIPMAHDVDSLNVAAASAVAFWELC